MIPPAHGATSSTRRPPRHAARSASISPTASVGGGETTFHVAFSARLGFVKRLPGQRVSRVRFSRGVSEQSILITTPCGALSTAVGGQSLLVPNKKVVWEISNSYLSFVKDTNLITTGIGDPNSKEEAV